MWEGTNSRGPPLIVQVPCTCTAYLDFRYVNLVDWARGLEMGRFARRRRRLHLLLRGNLLARASSCDAATASPGANKISAGISVIVCSLADYGCHIERPACYAHSEGSMRRAAGRPRSPRDLPAPAQLAMTLASEDFRPPVGGRGPGGFVCLRWPLRRCSRFCSRGCNAGLPLTHETKGRPRRRVRAMTTLPDQCRHGTTQRFGASYTRVGLQGGECLGYQFHCRVRVDRPVRDQ